MPDWTPQQQNAIDARNSNILVYAAAGSGKTAVLVERVIKLIMDESLDAGIERLLIVTFTNAAAAEMKNRISSALYKIIKKEPNNSRAINQLNLLPTAKICTIDSFCINLVRENFFKLDISQDFSILDDSQQRLIEQNAIEEIIESHYQSENKDFKALVEMLSAAKNDDDLINSVKKIQNYISAQAFPFDWLDEICELYNPETSIDNSSLKDYVFSEIEYGITYIKSLIDECLNSIDPFDEMADKYTELLEQDALMFDEVENLLDSSWDEMKERIDSISFSNMPRAKKDYAGNAKQLVSSRRAQYKDIIKDIKKLMVCTSDEFRKDNEYLYPKLRYLCNIVKEYNQKMLEVKKELNSYSFSDIEHFAIDLLFFKRDSEIIRTQLAKEYESSFFEILVDEYQDTNSAQDKLFEMLSNGSNRFMVGDIKQSIYRFRLAMPTIFNDKKDSFDYYQEKSQSFSQKIILDKNFRSRKGICDYTNFLFSNLMSRRIGELEYNSDEYLNCGAKYSENDIPSAQINIVETPEGEDSDEYEARRIAELILSKIEAKEQIKCGDDEYRDIKFSDFAILLRYTKNRMPIYAKVFSEYSIPVVANNRTNLFDNNEVSILISLLRTIDNPTRDVPLLATLMSVFYGYSADDIARARVDNSNENLFTSVSRQRDVFGRFLDDLERYRKYAASMSVESFLRLIISSTSYLSVISAMGNAEQRKLNVLKLLEIANRFDNGDNVGITAFMRYVDSIISSNMNIESASVVHNEENCVSIMSVHQSKGLEFPVVIFASTSHRYNNDLSDLVLMNYKQGIGLKINDEEKLIRYNSLQYECIKNLNSCASMSENLRLLYVAVTRAKEQFISFISLSDAQTRVNNLSKKIAGGYISPIVVKHINNDGDLLLMTALIHKDASKLRELCEGYVEYNSSSDFDLSINFVNEKSEPELSEEDAAQPDDETVKEIKEKLSFRYERSELSSFSSKRSASGLDDKDRGYKYFAKSKPAFLSEASLSSAQKGTAMHTFMQYCNYENAKNDLEREISRIVEASYLSQIQADSLSREKLSSFFGGEFAKRMFESDRIYREIKVSSFVGANEIENTDFDDKILIQGIADCVFEENGELVLVDYKTDYVKNENELLDLYKKQIAFYKSAVSKALEKPVKEAMLYSFCLGKPCVYK